MNSFNYEVCEYISTPVTENFRTCEQAGGWEVESWVCPSECQGIFLWDHVCINP